MDVPGEKLLIKVIETFERGTGALLLPWQIKRTEAARREVRRAELLELAQARRDASEIKQGRKVLTIEGKLETLSGPNTNDSRPVPSNGRGETNYLARLMHEHNRSSTAQEFERWINLKQIGLKAEEEAENVGDEGVSDDSVDPDWFSQWRNGAQDVSHEQMQRLWARILACETRNPGAYSLRTLNFLTHMSKDDAELIARMAPFLIGTNHIYAKLEEFFESRGIDFSDLLYLEDMGILNGCSGVGNLSSMQKSRMVGSEYYVTLRSYDSALVFFANDGPKKYSFPVYVASRVGIEIMSLGKFTADMDYLKAIAKREAGNFNRTEIGELDRSNDKIINLRSFSIE